MFYITGSIVSEISNKIDVICYTSYGVVELVPVLVKLSIPMLILLWSIGIDELSMDIDMLSCATTGVTIDIPANNDAATAILKIANAYNLFMQRIIVFIL